MRANGISRVLKMIEHLVRYAISNTFRVEPQSSQGASAMEWCGIDCKVIGEFITPLPHYPTVQLMYIGGCSALKGYKIVYS
ncbi:hypothetical protein EYC80_007543 [Monilinia laxa]|uniref:Uncharacterized protein n=1 Tax=Monilinia laxa TaxID=61186 RepID=A0A5N6JW85_MONLA|nr:hypothetical protein EYC80_007543 [Monilinia laxa]